MREKETPIQRRIKYNITSMDEYSPLLIPRGEENAIGEISSDEERLNGWLFAAEEMYRPSGEFFAADRNALRSLPNEVCNYCLNEGTLKEVA